MKKFFNKRVFLIVLSLLMVMTSFPFPTMTVNMTVNAEESIPGLVKIAEGGQLTEIGTAIKNGTKYMHLYDNDMTYTQAINYAVDNYLTEIQQYTGTGDWAENCEIVYAKSSNDRNVYKLIKKNNGTKSGTGWAKDAGMSNQGTAKERGATFNMLFYSNNEYNYSVCSDTDIGAVYFFGTVEDYPEYEWNEVTIDTYSLSISKNVNETSAKTIAQNKIANPTGNEYVVFGTNGRKYKYLVYSGGQWTYTSDNQKYMYELRNDVSNNSKKVYVIGYNSELDSRYRAATLCEITTETRNISLFDSSMDASTAQVLLNDFLDQGLIEMGNYQFTDGGVQKTFKNEIQVYYSKDSNSQYKSWRHNELTNVWEESTLYTSPEGVIENLNQGTPDGKQIFYDYKYYVIGTTSGLNSELNINKISYNTKSFTLQNNYYVSPEDAANIAKKAVNAGKLTENDILVYYYNAYYNDTSSSIVVHGTYEYVYYEDGEWKASNTGGTGKDGLISYISLRELEGESFYILGTTTSYGNGDVAQYLGATITYDKKTGKVSVSDAAPNPSSYTYTIKDTGTEYTEEIITCYEIRKNDTYSSLHNPNGDYYNYFIGTTTHKLDEEQGTTTYYAQMSFSNSGIKKLNSGISSFTISADEYNDVDKADLQIAAVWDQYVGYDDINLTKSYAVYEYQYFALPNKITFNLNGGKIGTSSSNVIRYLTQGTSLDKQSLEIEANPAKDNSVFVGWYDAETGGNKVTTLSTRANITLYARYKEAISKEMLDYAEPTNLVYDGTGKTATVTVKSGVTGLSNENITVNYYSDEACTQKLSEAPKDVGTYYVAVDTTETDTYAPSTAIYVGKFEITKASGLVVTAPTTTTKTYDKQSLSGEATSEIDGTTITYQTKSTLNAQYGSSSSKIPTITNVGTLYVKATASNKNYFDASIEYVLSINARQLSITGSTANGKVYDCKTTAQISLGTVSNKIDGDDVTVIASGKFSDKNVGNGKNVTIKYSLSGAQAGNYIAPEDDITPADITAASLSVSGTTINSKKYDGLREATATLGTVSGIYTGDDVQVSIDTALFDNKDAATNKTVQVTYKLEGQDAGNYSISSTQHSANITKREITLTSASATKSYDGIALTKNDVTVSGDGFVGNEGFESCGADGSLTGIGCCNNKIYYTFNSNTVSGNYVIKENLGTLSVTESADAKYHVDMDSIQKVFKEIQDENSDITGLLFGISTDEKDINSNDVDLLKAQVTGDELLPIGVSISLATNYAYEQLNGFNSPKPINFSIDFDFATRKNVQIARVYHETVGDAETTTYPELTVINSEDLGAININELDEYAILDKENNKIYFHCRLYATYAVGYDEKTPISITADSKEKVYDGKPLSVEAKVAVTDGTTITYQTKLTQDGEYGNPSTKVPSITNASTVYVKATAVNDGYLSASIEYVLTVNKKQLTISGTKAKDKTYDGTTVADITLGTLSGVVDGDKVDISVTGTFTDKNVGEGKNISVVYTISGEDSCNYISPVSENISADIIQDTLTIEDGNGDENTTLDEAEAGNVDGSNSVDETDVEESNNICIWICLIIIGIILVAVILIIALRKKNRDK